MNINPAHIRNCIKDMVHGVKLDDTAMGSVEKLRKGDVCIIRQTSQEVRYKAGVMGIWVYYDKEDIENKIEPLWHPSNGWKYKIYMTPLVKRFKEPFFENFYLDIPGQQGIKSSLKVNGLLLSDIQEDTSGAITMDFRKSYLPKRYLKAIIEEKKSECDIQVNYENFRGNEMKINVYEFLSDIVGDVSYLKPNRGEKSRNINAQIFQKARHFKKYPSIESGIEIDNSQKIESNKAGIAFCPDCGTLLRPKTTKNSLSLLYCKECDKGFKT